MKLVPWLVFECKVPIMAIARLRAITTMALVLLEFEI